MATTTQQKEKFSREKLRDALHIFQYVYPYRWYLIGGFFILLLSSSATMVIPYLSGQMVDVSQDNAETDWSLRDIGKILIFIFVLQGVTSYFRVLLFAYASEKGVANVRKAVFGRLIGLPLSFFEENKSGDLISRISADIGKMYNMFSTTLAEFVRQFLTLVVAVVLLLFRSTELAYIMLMIFPAVIVAAMLFGRYVRRLSKERQEELAVSNSFLGESIQAIQAVKIFTNEFFEFGRYQESINKTVSVSLKYARARALFALVIIVMLFGSIFFILWRGAGMVEDGTMTVGLLIEFLFYMIFIGTSVGSLGSFYTEILGALGATERIREILKEDTEINAEATKPKRDLFLKGNIQYQNIQFSYPTRPDVEVLKGLDLEVQAGQKVALVGASGAGKSTIFQLLLQFYELDSGRIIVDGKNIQDYDRTNYRQNIAVVPQEVILFSGSIRENIAYGKHSATDAEIIEAAKQANAYEFISSFPEGFDTVVGERGVKLSGGQRQRIAIARAILKNPAILLLDEATSSLDAESEKVVQDALNVLMEGRTSIIIAHRLSTIRDVDVIYVLEDGQIVEQGTHTELSMKEDGAYNQLAKLQFDILESENVS
ncbi:MAG: ABC transporter transmembrane domain-containing protein [Bacteroidota bacterium]